MFIIFIVYFGLFILIFHRELIDNKKVKKGKSAELIASELEEEVSVIQPLYDAVAAEAPEYDMEKIRQTLYGTF